jgi:hypothetical protein
MQELMTQPAVSTRETYVSTRELSMKREFNAYAASGPKGRLEPFSFDPGPLEPEDVEMKVTHCGLCHSDLSMLDNEWGMSQYPFVPGDSRDFQWHLSSGVDWPFDSERSCRAIIKSSRLEAECVGCYATRCSTRRFVGNARRIFDWLPPLP